MELDGRRDISSGSQIPEWMGKISKKSLRQSDLRILKLIQDFLKEFTLNIFAAPGTATVVLLQY